MSTAQTARERFAADLCRANVKLPLTVSPHCHASIIDVEGSDVFTVDMNRDRPDAEAVQIALWIVLAVNTCGGFAVAASIGASHE